MNASTCLASTGFNAIPIVLFALFLIGAGAFALRSGKARVLLLVILLAGGTFTLTLSTAKPASAACGASATTTPNPTTTTTATVAAPTALTMGASYLISEFNSNGAVNGYSGPSYAATAQTVVALVESGVTSSAAQNAIASGSSYLASHITDFVDGSGNSTGCTSPPSDLDSSLNLAWLLITAEVTHNSALVADESSFISRILATQGLDQTAGDQNFFGACIPYDQGTWAQATVIDALVLAGQPTSSSPLQNGLSWLLDQQCLSNGGGFTADLDDSPCSGLASNWQGPDTNSTGIALTALAAMGVSPSSATSAAVSYLQSNELSSAGWDWFGGGLDSNSTAVVINGLNAVGQDTTATTGTWAKVVSGVPTSPMETEGTFQVSTSGVNYGGFFFQPGSLPDSASSYEAMIALSRAAVPV